MWRRLSPTLAMKKPEPGIIELDVAQFEELKQHVDERAFEEADYAKLRGVLDAYLYLLELVDNKSTTIGRLRKLLFGASTEKTADVVGRDAPADSECGPRSSAPAAPQNGAEKKREKKPGHGRNGADRYAGASRVKIRHASLEPGDPCPECSTGTAYLMVQPGVLIRFIGQPPLGATIYELQKLRCNLCGKIFTAQPPAEAGPQKYDASAVSIIAMLRYGLGLPFNRLDRMQKDLEIPLPASTQWEIVAAGYDGLTPVYEEFIRQAAQGELVHHDDTNVKILELMGDDAKQKAFDESSEENKADADPERKGMFTSGVVAVNGDKRIALFFSGRRHAGENLVEVLRRRASGLPPPIQMCDALSRNMPSDLKTVVANCLAHGRRQFVDVNERFPAECRYVLEALEKVYHHDDTARKNNLSAEARLAFHQAYSGPVMEELRGWLKQQFSERLVEPNSGLGAAINYLLKHWEKLTLFLRVAGAPLDNNLCERALKKAIMHRKNSLFYKTQHGADVGDLYMSLIHTCELNGVNPFDYLTELQRHTDAVAANPAAWLPWNYREQLVPAVA
jgi:transposase